MKLICKKDYIIDDYYLRDTIFKKDKEYTLIIIAKLEYGYLYQMDLGYKVIGYGDKIYVTDALIESTPSRKYIWYYFYTPEEIRKKKIKSLIDEL